MQYTQASNALKTTWQALRRPKDSSLITILALVFIVVFDNTQLWTQIWQRNPGHTLQTIYLVMCVAVIAGALTFLAVSLFSSHRTLKPALGALLYAGASIGYFNQIGVVFDETMIENIILSDAREANELLSLDYLVHMGLYFLIPAALVILIQVKKESFVRFVVSRVVINLCAIALALGVTLIDYQSFSFFIRENTDLKAYVNPVYPMLSAKRYLKQKIAKSTPFVALGEDATQAKRSKKRTVGVFVVGETARADHFSLNHYPRKTNPQLETRGVISFSAAQSCGTSTAFSLPCMFSFINSNDYKPQLALNQSNVLDVLEQAGVKTLWRDNNSSCKGVCERIETENFRLNPDPDSEFFNIDQYYDEILLGSLREQIASTEKDILIVLHPLGSHGPSYHRRYPTEFERFTPACKSDSPQSCSHDEVVNAYDNTILYTDYIVSKVIDLLNENAEAHDAFVVYASDHGESLGENGIYLHGIPRLFAPKEQTHIPFIVWLSDNEKQKLNLSNVQLNDCRQQAISHDHISHSLLSLFDVESSIYNEQLNIFKTSCGDENVAYAE